MFRQLPINNLIRLNLMITVLISLLVFIFVTTFSHDVLYSFTRFLQNVVFMVLLTSANLLLWGYLYKDGLTDKRDKILFYICSYAIAFLDFCIVKWLYTWITNTRWEGEGAHPFESYLLAFLSTSILNTLILIIQNLVILQYKQNLSKIENLELKSNVMEASNLLLRQQIHPHFLFNALSTIKSLYKEDLQQGEEYLVYLADFLRVSIANQTAMTTLISDEVNFCMDYLKMQKVRFGSALNYSIDISEQTIKTKYLPYFSLQPLVENVLKHNFLTEKRPVTIAIRESDGYITVSNNLQEIMFKEKSTQSGLYNLAERYRLLGEEAIKITTDNGFFTVRLKILDK